MTEDQRVVAKRESTTGAVCRIGVSGRDGGSYKNKEVQMQRAVQASLQDLADHYSVTVRWFQRQALKEETRGNLRHQKGAGRPSALLPEDL